MIDMAETKKVRKRYGIAEWYGRPLRSLSSAERVKHADAALGESDRPTPACPFQEGRPKCSKEGGVCSIQQYEEAPEGQLGPSVGGPVIVCPKRFDDSHLLVEWLGEIVGFDWSDIRLAREVPFMESTSTGKSAGKVDLVVARTAGDHLNWYGLEIQAVYFSGSGMTAEFEAIRADSEGVPFPIANRRPDWRSSSAKRLMPQLEVKVPTMRRWHSKMAVAVDRPFFEVIGGQSDAPTKDLDDGDIIWLVPELTLDEEGPYRLRRGHWEVLTLEASSKRLLAARTVSRSQFESVLKSKLRAPLSGP